MKQKINFYIIISLFLGATLVFLIINKEFKWLTAPKNHPSNNPFSKNITKIKIPKVEKLEIKSLPLTSKYSLPVIKSKFIPLWANYLNNIKSIREKLKSISDFSFQETNKWGKISNSIITECQESQKTIEEALNFVSNQKQENILKSIKDKNKIFGEKMENFVSLMNKELVNHQKEKERLEQAKKFMFFKNNFQNSFNQIVVQNQKINKIISQINNLIKSNKNKEIFPLIKNLKKENSLLTDKIKDFKNYLNNREIGKTNFLFPAYLEIKKQGNEVYLKLLDYNHQLNVISDSLKLILKGKENSYSDTIYNYKYTIKNSKNQILKLKNNLAKTEENINKQNSGKELKNINNSLNSVYFAFSNLIKSINSFQESL